MLDNKDISLDDFPTALDAPISSSKPLIYFNPTPITISTIDELITQISSYFDYCNTNKENPTFTGLALNVGFTRQRLRKFPIDNPDHPFSPFLSKAMAYIVEFAEKQLFEPKSSAGTAFWLKNNDDWQDKHDINVTQQRSMVDVLAEIKNISTSSSTSSSTTSDLKKDYKDLFIEGEVTDTSLIST